MVQIVATCQGTIDHIAKSTLAYNRLHNLMSYGSLHGPRTGYTTGLSDSMMVILRLWWGTERFRDESLGWSTQGGLCTYRICTLSSPYSSYVESFRIEKLPKDVGPPQDYGTILPSRSIPGRTRIRRSMSLQRSADCSFGPLPVEPRLLLRGPCSSRAGLL